MPADISASAARQPNNWPAFSSTRTNARQYFGTGEAGPGPDLDSAPFHQLPCEKTAGALCTTIGTLHLGGALTLALSASQPFHATAPSPSRSPDARGESICHLSSRPCPSPTPLPSKNTETSIWQWLHSCFSQQLDQQQQGGSTVSSAFHYYGVRYLGCSHVCQPQRLPFPWFRHCFLNGASEAPPPLPKKGAMSLTHMA